MTASTQLDRSCSLFLTLDKISINRQLVHRLRALGPRVGGMLCA